MMPGRSRHTSSSASCSLVEVAAGSAPSGGGSRSITAMASPLVQRLEVGHDRPRPGRRGSRSAAWRCRGLTDWLSRIQAARFVGGVGDRAGADRASGPEVGEVRPDRAVGGGAGDGVATGARPAPRSRPAPRWAAAGSVPPAAWPAGGRATPGKSAGGMARRRRPCGRAGCRRTRRTGPGRCRPGTAVNGWCWAGPGSRPPWRPAGAPRSCGSRPRTRAPISTGWPTGTGISLAVVTPASG